MSPRLEQCFALRLAIVVGAALVSKTLASQDEGVHSYHVDSTHAVNRFTLAPGKCRLLATSETHGRVRAKLDSNTKLLVYDVTIDGYLRNPLLEGMTVNYKTNTWYRSSSKHGLAILNLAFNYDVLSLTMLKFGVDSINITLKGI